MTSESQAIALMSSAVARGRSLHAHLLPRLLPHGVVSPPPQASTAPAAPVILHPHDEKRWLNAEHLTEITGMLEPFQSDEMNAYPISNKIQDTLGQRL